MKHAPRGMWALVAVAPEPPRYICVPILNRATGQHVLFCDPVDIFGGKGP